MFDHRKVQRAAVIHDLASEFRGGDGLAVVRNGHDSRVAHGSDVRDVFALAANAGGADGPDSDMAKGFSAIDDEARYGSVVVDGPGVGHTADGGEAAACGRMRPSFDRFGVFLAGL